MEISHVVAVISEMLVLTCVVRFILCTMWVLWALCNLDTKCWHWVVLWVKTQITNVFAHGRTDIKIWQLCVCLSICPSVFEAATAIQPRFRVCTRRLNESGGVKMYEWNLCCFCYLLPKMWQSGNNSHCLELTCLTRWRANFLLLPKRCCNIGCLALAGIGFHADLSLFLWCGVS